MKKLLQPSFAVPVIVFVLLTIATLLFIAALQSIQRTEDPPAGLDYTSIDRARPLTGKRRYTDDYNRPGIINAMNLHSKVTMKASPDKIAEAERRREPGFLDDILNLVWSINYQPAALSSAHKGLEGECSACHSLTGDGFNAKCLNCHTAMAEKIESQKGFHYNRQNENCQSCHLEHTGDKLALVPMHSFRHANTDYKLSGYHKKADCYDCHRTASVVRPNNVISVNNIPRSTLRFSLEEFDSCQSCHPDPHKPSFGSGCMKCHPLHLRWFQ